MTATTDTQTLASADSALPPVVVTRTFRARPGLVFDAFTKPEMLARWWGPHGYTGATAQVDLRVGGTYRFTMRDSDGQDMAVGGTYRAILPGERLSYTWNWLEGGPYKEETLVTVEFRPHAQGTELVLTHEGILNPRIQAGHSKGWTSSFDSLDQFLGEETGND